MVAVPCCVALCCVVCLFGLCWFDVGCFVSFRFVAFRFVPFRIRLVWFCVWVCFVVVICCVCYGCVVLRLLCCVLVCFVVVICVSFKSMCCRYSLRFF